MVVADSGPLIAFARLSLLELLPETFGRVLVPDVVVAECTAQPHRPGAKAIAMALADGLLEAVEVEGAGRFADLHLIDEGEASALLLAMAEACPTLIDERRGRRVASRLGVPVVGTVGVLLAARQREAIPALRPLFEELNGFGYRVSAVLVAEALARAGES